MTQMRNTLGSSTYQSLLAGSLPLRPYLRPLPPPRLRGAL